jgi:hypothetical protein
MIYRKKPLNANAPEFLESINPTVISAGIITAGATSTALSFAFTGAGPGGIMAVIKLF